MSNIQKQHKISPAIAWLTIQKFIIFYCPLDGEHTTLVKYITDVKMMKAKVMLEEGTLKIVQIAKACGYENQSYFNKLFKNYYGITPKQLREKI